MDRIIRSEYDVKICMSFFVDRNLNSEYYCQLPSFFLFLTIITFILTFQVNLNRRYYDIINFDFIVPSPAPCC